jgi:hypothetical protein
VLIVAALYRLHATAPLTLRRYCRPRISNRLADVAKMGRNEPCPCGSGRKYKLCHGAIAIAPVAPPPAATVAGGKRECGSCTACCEGWAEGEIRGHRMHAGQHCHFLQAGACTIYDERPQSPCRNFVCGWLAPGSPFPDAFRPDLSGVIIVTLRWRDGPCYVLLPAGNDAGPEMLDWMKPYARQSGAPFYYAVQGQRLGYGPVAFQQEMLDKLQRGLPLW